MAENGTEIPTVNNADGDQNGQGQDTTTGAGAASSTTVTVSPMSPSASRIIPEATDENFRRVAIQVSNLDDLVKQLKHELELANARSDELAKQLQEVKGDKEKHTKDKDTDHLDKDGIRPLKQLDRKDVDKPDKYNGNVDQLLKWSKNFKKFLRRHDERWTTLLELIEKNGGKPVTADMESKWATEAGLGNYLKDFKAQLNEYLESYTSGAAKTLVEACGDRKSLDAWRQLADKGHSMRAAHVHMLRKKAFFPRTNVATKDLENAISTWEADIELFEAAAIGETMPSQNKKMSLIEMCTEQLKKHLKAMEHIKAVDYEDLKVEIADWIAENEITKNPGLKNLNDVQEDQQHDDAEWITIEDAENATHAELLALVKNKFTKKGTKGRGKNGGPPYRKRPGRS